MREYPLLIAGRDEPGVAWNHAVRASAFLTDFTGSLALKGRADAGEDVGPDHRLIARCAVAGQEEEARAVQAARRSATEFGRSSLEDRLALVHDIAAAFEARAEELLEILVAEGHPRTLALWEIDGCFAGMSPAMLEWNASMLHQALPGGIALTRKADGVVCVQPPQNAAASNSCLGILALLAGNALVVNAPRATPTGVMFVYREIVAPVLARHGAPQGVLNVTSGPAQRVVDGWIASDSVDTILFFGDTARGLAIGSRAYQRGKKTILELSGNDVFVVWEDADLERAAWTLTEAYSGSGQICMVPKVAIVHPACADDFLDLHLQAVGKIRPGLPEDPTTILSPVRKLNRFEEFVHDARRAGGSILCGGETVDLHGAPSPSGPFAEPTLVRFDGWDGARDSLCVKEEAFFPLLPVIVPSPGPDAELEKIIEFVNANRFGLRCSLWARDATVIDTFTRGVMNAGQIKVNRSHIGFEPSLATHGGPSGTGGPFGELNNVALRTSHLQGISIGSWEE